MTFSLTFSQLRGNFTAAREDTNLPHPYIVLKVGGQKTQTKALKNVENVGEWRESYTLHDIPDKSGGILEVSVQNHKTLLPDDTIGSGSANISNWTNKELSGQGEVSVQLVDKKGRGVGDLSFLVKHSNYSIEAAQRSVGAVPSQSLGGGVDETGGRVDGVGAGTTYEAAKVAAAKAAAEKRNVTVQTADGVAAGKPVGPSISGGNTATAQRDMQYETGPGLNGGAKTSGIEGNGLSSTVKTGVAGVDVKHGEIIDKKYYTGLEDRPQDQMLVERFREHRPYMRRYETTVSHTGRERQIGSRIETLGTEEHITGTQNNLTLPPHQVIARSLPAGGSDQAIGGEGWVQTEKGPICDSKKFEITGDVTVEKKRVTNLREHRDFEKEFEIKTTFVEEVPLTDKNYVEQLSRERVLRNEKQKVACEGHQSLNNIA